MLKKDALEGNLLQQKTKITGNPFVNKCDAMIKRCARLVLSYTTPVVNNRIIMLTYDSNYICNPRYIAEEILARGLNAELIWAVMSNGENDISQYPKEIKLVRRGTEEMLEALASSRIWIENALETGLYHIKKKKSQIAINTWHGSLGIKKLSGDKNWMNRAKKAKEYTDYCITNSVFEENVFRETFWPETPFLKYGHARNDIFFDERALKNKGISVRKFFGIDPDTKILLYAPTFRESNMYDIEKIDVSGLKKALTGRFGGKWVIMVRRHHKERTAKEYLRKDDSIIDASWYGDMQELLCAADVGLSDYSSWVYDYMLTKRPVFLYVPDIDDYDQARGFFYPLSETPFPQAENNDSLFYEIEHFDNDRYIEDVHAFLEDKGCYEQGNASKRIVDKIEELL